MKRKFMVIHEHDHGVDHHFFSSYFDWSGMGSYPNKKPDGELAQLIDFLGIDFDHDRMAETIEIVSVDNVFVQFDPK